MEVSKNAAKEFVRKSSKKVYEQTRGRNFCTGIPRTKIPSNFVNGGLRRSFVVAITKKVAALGNPVVARERVILKEREGGFLLT